MSRWVGRWENFWELAVEGGPPVRGTKLLAWRIPAVWQDLRENSLEIPEGSSVPKTQRKLMRETQAVLDEIAKDYAGKLTIAKLNIDDNPATPQHYGVRGIPTLMLFIDGEVEGTKVGALTKSQLSAFIDNYIK